MHCPPVRWVVVLVRAKEEKAASGNTKEEEVASSRKVRCEMHQLPPIVCVSCCPSSSSLFCLDMLLLQVDPGGHVLVASHQDRDAGKEETAQDLATAGSTEEQMAEERGHWHRRQWREEG